MKARFNIDGKQLEVVAINYFMDEISKVTVVDESGNFKTYHNRDFGSYTEKSLTVGLKNSLEFPEVQQLIDNKMEKLIQHLDEMYQEERGKLSNLAITAMEDASGFPFPEKSLVRWHEEYKQIQQRNLGILDTIEDVKAFQEGFFDERKEGN